MDHWDNAAHLWNGMESVQAMQHTRPRPRRAIQDLPWTLFHRYLSHDILNWWAVIGPVFQAMLLQTLCEVSDRDGKREREREMERERGRERGRERERERERGEGEREREREREGENVRDRRKGGRRE